MRIRKATIKELDQIMAIYAYAREFMAAHGNPNQWGPTNWPPEDLIRCDISRGRSYVSVINENDVEKIVGVFYYVYGENDTTYDVIENGKWSSDKTYGVVHRIAVHGARGVGSFCLNWAFEQCGYLRIDTHPDNAVMQGLLKKLGFKKCGIIYVEEDDYPRYAYDKN